MVICAVSLRRWVNVIRDFAANGQLLDLSVALVIGNTFQKVIESLVDHLLTPILGFLFDGIDIADLSAKLQSDRWPHKAPVILAYGKFLQQLIYFAVIAISLLILIAIINQVFMTRRKNQVGTKHLPTKQELILMEHTELLKAIERSLRK